MNGQELTRLLAPLLNVAGRYHLGPLMRGETSDVALRYDHVKDWPRLTQVLIDHVDELQLYDGAEWFTIQIEKVKSDVQERQDSR